MKRIPVLVIAVAAIFALGSYLIGNETGLWEELASLVVSEKTTSAAEQTLLQTREIAQLATIEYVRRTVFPHDFYLVEAPYRLPGRIAAAGKPASEVLTEQELSTLDAYNLALELGFGSYGVPMRFAVVTITVSIGYDLQSGPLGTLSSEQIIHAEDTTVRMYLPEAQILNVRIEDIHPEDYPFPPVLLQPEQYGRLTTFVADRIAEEVRSGELMERARTSAKEFFRDLFLQSGYQGVSFSAEPIEPVFP